MLIIIITAVIVKTCVKYITFNDVIIYYYYKYYINCLEDIKRTK